ncbi:hypothetical protein [Halosegnis longus]|uniref:hypothetical protein n=1 Tax=Halosegnis longus TaxID=2216012 RepID=UPI00117C2B65|nr:hypothetical protein [Salella cibi]
MADRLSNSAVQISQQEYQTAQSLLGDDFESDLTRYVDVAGETDSGSDTAETFAETRETQQEYAEESQSYQETYDEYEEAVAAGDTDRARELARELERLREAIEETNEALQTQYTELENRTGQSFNQAQESLTERTQEISSTTDEVLSQTLIATSIEIDQSSAQASFTDPLVITGRVSAANGTGVSNTSVALVLPGEDVHVRTDEAGAFRLEYRPVAVATGTQSLVVETRPAPTSSYQVAETSVTTRIEPVNGTLSVVSLPSNVGFNDPLSIRAQLTVDGDPVPDRRLNMTVGGVDFAPVSTNDTGVATFSPPLPASIPVGTQQVTLSPSQDTQAVQAAPVTRTLTVDQTDTTLSVQAENGSPVALSGTLEAVDGVGIGNQPIRIQANGTVIQTLQTTAAGNFTTTLGPQQLPANEESVISVQYDGAGSNLAPAQTNATVLLGEAGAGGQSSAGAGGQSSAGAGGQSSVNLPLVPLAGGVGLVGTILVGLLWYRRSGESSASDAPDESVVEDPSSVDDTSPDATLAEINEQVDAGKHDDAAVALYQTVLQTLPIDPRPSMTHWEQYQQATTTLDPDQTDLLERATTLYEQAKFAPTAVPVESVTDLSETLKHQLSRETQPSPSDD